MFFFSFFPVMNTRYYLGLTLPLSATWGLRVFIDPWWAKRSKFRTSLALRFAISSLMEAFVVEVVIILG